MSTEEIIYILQNNTFLFQQNNMIVSFFRFVGWKLSELFIWLASATSSLFDAVFGFLSFTDDNGVLGSFVRDFRPVVFAILIVSIFALGILLIVKHDKKPQLLTNILIFVLVVTSSGYVMNLMNDVIVSGKSAIVGASSSDVAYQTAAADIYDLVYIDSQHGGISYLLDKGENEKADYGTYDTFTSKDLSSIDINEVLNYNSSKYGLSDEVKSVLKKKIVYFHDNSLISTDNVYAGFGINFDDTANWFNEFYYRYSIDFIPLWISMIALIIIYIVMAYKVFRLIFELGIMRIIALVTSANITGGQKAVRTLDAIKNSYIVILVCCLLIRFYQLACTAMNGVEPIANNGLIKALCRLFLAFAVVDGPNLIEWLFGIDAGLQSGVGRIMAAWHIGKGVGYATGRGVKKTANALGKLFGGDDKPGKEGADIFNNNSGEDKTSGLGKASPDPNNPLSGGGGSNANQTPGGMDNTNAPPDGDNAFAAGFQSADNLNQMDSAEAVQSALNTESNAASNSSFEEAFRQNFPDAWSDTKESETSSSVGDAQGAAGVLNGTDAYGNAAKPDEILSGLDSAQGRETSLNGTSNSLPDMQSQRANEYSGAIFKDKSMTGNNAVSKIPADKKSSVKTQSTNRQMPRMSSERGGNVIRKEKFVDANSVKGTGAASTKPAVKSKTAPAAKSQNKDAASQKKKADFPKHEAKNELKSDIKTDEQTKR